VAQPRSGTARLTGSPLKVGYTPAAGFFGQDRFVYTLKTTDGLLDRGLVKVNISPSSPPTYQQTAANEAQFTNDFGPPLLAGDCKASPTPGNHLPQANRDTLTIHGRVLSSDLSEYSINVLANDHDPDPGDTIHLIDDFPRRT